MKSIITFILLCCISAVVHGQNFKVTLLGTGKPLPEIDRFGPATLVEAGDQKFLFDCGRGTSQRLWQLKISLGSINHVFMTHLHSDHTVGFPDLWLTGLLPLQFGSRKEPLLVFGPAGTVSMMDHLKQAFSWDISVRTNEKNLAGSEIKSTDITEGVIFENAGAKITAFLVDHGAHLKPAFGYRVDYNGRSVVISGDTRFNENLIRYSKGADVVIHEVIVAKEELLAKSQIAKQIVSLHTLPEEAGKVFESVKPKLAVYTHIILFSNDPAIPAPSLEDIVTRTRKSYNGPLELGEDLMSITIGDKVQVERYKFNNN